jgi:hypothetical protein
MKGKGAPMKFDIFSGRKKEKTGTLRDDIEKQIKGIERFAPKQYRSEREMYYYNYQMMDLYLKPLFALLGIILEGKGRVAKEGESVFAGRLFFKLKDFYDPKGKLTLEEAIQDLNLKRKLQQVFVIFYNRKEFSAGELEKSLAHGARR